MDTITILEGNESLNESYKWLQAPLEIQRIQFYSSRIYKFYYITKKETDTHIYWSLSVKTPMFMNDTLFYKRSTESGATYEKSTRKIKIWFGNHINKLPSQIKEDILLSFAPWMMDTTPSIGSLMNNTIFSKVISGKITSVEGIVSDYIKTSPYKKMDIDIKLFTEVFTQYAKYVSPKALKNIFLTATTTTEALNYIRDVYVSTYFFDTQHTRLCNIAAQLGKKVDLTISEDAVEPLLNEYYRLRDAKLLIYEHLG